MSELHREPQVIAASSVFSLSLAKGEVVPLSLGKTNAAMAYPARPQGTKAG